ncbi:MAG: Peptidase rane alanine aminopeptidase, partial [Bacteroidota bacterium]|nr:Peptidase rane alanine aminopeptidase [Bacteroidota bacterium]
CKQDLQDKIDSIDIIITCPNAYRGASNGLLVKETDYNGYRTCYWKHRYPIATYLVCMAVSNYATYYNYVPYQGDTLPVLVYAYPEDTDYAKSSTPAIIPMIQLYDSIFGMYPFSKEKYGMVEFGWGGGMEHQTMTFESDFSFELMAHELGHHWFGDKVTCASWEDIWLNEGFAVYLSGLCYQYIGTEWWYAFRYTRIAGSCTEPSGSVWCSDTTSVGRIFNAHLSYSKGAMVLHMLRWELGDSLFFTGLKNYLNDINNAYSFANTTSLRQHLEAASGKDLSGFFYNWVYGKGYPSYQIAWTQDFGNHVSLTMSQTQSDPSVSFYDMPVAVQFKNATSDTTIVLNHTFSGQSFSFDIPFVADTLIFDPDLWIISAKNTITRQAAYNFSFFIYPNPTRTTLQMRVESNVERSGDLKIYNELGQVLRQNTVNLQPGVNFLNTDIQNFPGGVYRVSIKASGKTITSSFVVR